MLDRNPSSREVWTQTWLELTPTFADDSDQFWHPINQLKCSLENAIVLISRHKKVFFFSSETCRVAKESDEMQ